jgi:hypothetical protein
MKKTLPSGIADAVDYCNSTLRSVTIPSNLLINEQLAMKRRQLLVCIDTISTRFLRSLKIKFIPVRK